MCGRFSLTASDSDIAARFGVDAFAAIPQRYNIAPTQPILAVRLAPKVGRELTALEWGLVPEWAKERSRGRPLINARVETIEEKASFRSPIKRTRCLVPFTGWYEWRQEKGRKQPYLIEPVSREVAAFAALWTVWHGEMGDHWLETVALVTAEATGPLKSVHHRKPLVVKPESYANWLTPHDPLPRNFWSTVDFEPESAFTMRPVRDVVNSIAYDGSECHMPPRPPSQHSLFDF